MAVYFPSSDNERDTPTILHSREHLPSSYSDAPVYPSNLMMYTKYSSSSGSYPGTLAGNIQQHSSGIAILPAPSSSHPSQQENLPDIGGPQIGENDLNGWKNGRNSMLLMHHVGDAAAVLEGPQNMQSQGLSLSLSTHVPSGFQMSSLQCRSPNPGYSSFLNANSSISGEVDGRNGYFEVLDSSQTKQSRHTEYLSPGFPGSNSEAIRADASAYGVPSIERAVSNSKYLKAAQQLLDEVVNVKKALKEQSSKNGLMKVSKEVDGGPKTGDSDHPGSGSSLNPQESSSELSAAEKQALQNKMSKLLAMLDEVDRRYKQYYHQMQIVVSSFDVIAGSGAARPYTALAFQTISRHFRCLQDSINEQVQVTRKSLGEQDASANSKGIGISRLRYVDQQIKQQRAFQQLGMMQQHAWRPQRGLPETSVTILRAWLFEHFLHPYPKDSDKVMLARQTGLTRSQVSNWFINARVRLWKPMVEEMYKEETVDTEMDSNSPSDVAAKPAISDTKASEDRGEDLLQSTTSISTAEQLFESNSDHFADVEMMEPNISQSFQNVSHSGTESEYGLGESRGNQMPALNDCSVLPDTTIIQSSEGSGRFMAAAAAAYNLSELERLENGSGVSLTLGLQHRDGSSAPMSIETRQNYIPTRGDDAIYSGAVSSIGDKPAEFDCMDSGNRRHRFGFSQSFHDFVA